MFVSGDGGVAAVVLCGACDLDPGGWAISLPVWPATPGWVRLVLAVAVVTLVVVAVRVVRGWWWRRAVASGYWLRITPPRSLDVGQAGGGWRLLVGLARLARRGWHLARPPLAFEIVHTGHTPAVGLWLPGWVPVSAVTDEVGRVWPGARVERVTPPMLGGHRGTGARWRVAGYRLVAQRPEVGPLVDDTRLGGRPARGAAALVDVLSAVYTALCRPGGPAMVQVLVRPATRRRVARLARAARMPAGARPHLGVVLVRGVLALVLGVLRLLLAVVAAIVAPARSIPRRSSFGGYEVDQPGRVDRLETAAMRQAAEKLATGPHVLATVRTGAACPQRAGAAAAARSIGDGFVTVARHLRPVRMWQAARLLDQRRARRREWLLLSTDELAVLAHLPSDPARYGFTTAALHRPPPPGVRRAVPERPTATGPGWTRSGWSSPPEPTGCVFADEHDLSHADLDDGDLDDGDLFAFDPIDPGQREDDDWPYREAA